ncbi:alpha/beta fold hydrolase [Streptomyces sp. NBC_01006]|uniref:alpha/beta fold hydrolase n=1 Tax=Streptomyces sp. NBC_01006 TaxID=2903716 RepID=UPI0038696553|nr:alpha/beta hydrolase [Streptomyces sp. NBC_01006]
MTIQPAGPGSEFVTASDGVRLWTGRHADGPITVIKVHGGPGSWDESPQPGPLLSRWATLTCWDQRGAGRSDRVGPYSLAQSVADLDAIRTHTGHERVVLLGHSYGAHLALIYALTHPTT